MSDLLLGLLSALVATNAPAAVSNLVHQQTGYTVTVPGQRENDPFEQEYLGLLAKDDAAQAEVDRWIQQARSDSLAEDAPMQRALLQRRVEKRFAPVREAYKTFLQRHPEHVRARLAYGSFLNDLGEEDAAKDQWEKARELDHQNPAAWNNLANYYGHNGPVSRAFEYYERAIALNPTESVYFQNLATTVYLFRRDATNYYGLSVEKVLAKAMALYEQALALDPKNFALATDVAQTYYGIPTVKTGDLEQDKQAALARADQALAAWQRAYELARDDVERQGVLLHLARIQINAGRFAEATRCLNLVTHEMYASTKGNLLKKLAAVQARRSPGQAAPDQGVPNGPVSVGPVE